MAPMPPPSPAAAAAPFLGWRVVGAAFVGQAVSNACTLNAYGVFVRPLAEEFGTTVGAISNGAGLALLAMALPAPLVGRWIDRGPARAVMLAGVALCAAGMLLLSRAGSLLELALCFGVAVAVGSSCFGPLPTVALVGKWFVRRRGLALGLAVSGATLSAAATPPLAAWLVDALGWRHAIAAFGVGALVLAAPVFALCVVRSPEDAGQHPDGDAEAFDDPAAHADDGSPRALLRDRNFPLFALGFGLLFSSPLVTAVHLVPFAEGLGVSRQDAAWVLSLLAAGSLCGKLVFGIVADRVDPRAALFLEVGLLAASWVVLLAAPTHAGLLFAGALMGLGIGAVIPLQGVVVGRVFGRGAMGQVIGLGGLFALPLIAGSAPAVGALYDATGSYRIAFGAVIAALLLAGALFAMLRIPAAAPRVRA
jgi:MFS family permease